MKEADLTQLAGALLDNALEAAEQARAKYVSVEMRRVDDHFELRISNTFPPDMNPALLAGGMSCKPGHAGVGIASCEEIISRYKNTILNLRVSGPYVDAQVLL